MTKRKIIYAFLNKIIETHLENLNGQVPNYNIVINALPKDSFSISSLINTNQNIIVERDAQIIFEKQKPAFVFNINPNALNALLQFNKTINSNFNCPSTGEVSNNDKKTIFDKLNEQLNNQFNYIDNLHFDNPTWNNNTLLTVKIRNGYLSDNLNYAFGNLDFKFRTSNTFNENVPRKPVYIPRPSLSCPDWKWCLLNPAYCVACKSLKATLNALPSRIKAGSVGGNIEGSGSIIGNLKSIQFDESLSNVTINKDLDFRGNLNYDLSYNGFDGIGFVLTCYNLQFKGNPSVRGSISNPSLNVSILKENIDDLCNVKLNIQPIKYQVILSPPPIVDIFTNIRNYLTCNAGMTVLGVGFGLGTITGKMFDLGEVETILNALTTGKYDSELELKTITFPIEYYSKTRFGTYKLKTNWGNKSLNASF